LLAPNLGESDELGGWASRDHLEGRKRRPGLFLRLFELLQCVHDPSPDVFIIVLASLIV
jgi:hypothetical protein